MGIFLLGWSIMAPRLDFFFFDRLLCFSAISLRIARISSSVTSIVSPTSAVSFETRTTNKEVRFLYSLASSSWRVSMKSSPRGSRLNRVRSLLIFSASVFVMQWLGCLNSFLLGGRSSGTTGGGESGELELSTVMSTMSTIADSDTSISGGTVTYKGWFHSNSPVGIIRNIILPCSPFSCVLFSSD